MRIEIHEAIINEDNYCVGEIVKLTLNIEGNVDVVEVIGEIIRFTDCSISIYVEEYEGKAIDENLTYLDHEVLKIELIEED